MAKRIPILDSIKGICVIFVIITHFPWTDAERTRMLLPFWVGMAVPIFMIISGYVYAASYESNNITSFSEAYAPKFLINKILRFMIPFSIAITAEFILDPQFTVTDRFIDNFLIIAAGGNCNEYGNYYFPIMMQFIFVFPAIWFTVKKNPQRGLLICFVLNIAYEVMQRAYQMNYSSYKYLLFRYLFAIAFGCFLFLNKEHVKKLWYVLAFVVGAVFLTAHRYFGYMPDILTHWTSTSCLAVLFVVPIVAYIIKKLGHIKIPPLEIVGKASFNIFLVQMLFYNYFDKTGPFFPNKYIHVGLNILICVSAGILFYIVESRLTRLICKYTNALISYAQSWKNKNTTSVHTDSAA